MSILLQFMFYWKYVFSRGGRDLTVFELIAIHCLECNSFFHTRLQSLLHISLKALISSRWDSNVHNQHYHPLKGLIYWELYILWKIVFSLWENKVIFFSHFSTVEVVFEPVSTGHQARHLRDVLRGHLTLSGLSFFLNIGQRDDSVHLPKYCISGVDVPEEDKVGTCL